MSFSPNKKKVLEYLYDNRAVNFPVDELARAVKINGSFSVTITRLQAEALIQKSATGIVALTESGKSIVATMRAQAPYYRHQFNQGTRCVKCGLNKKTVLNGPYWYDGDERVYTITPSCTHK